MPRIKSVDKLHRDKKEGRHWSYNGQNQKENVVTKEIETEYVEVQEHE